MFLAKTFVVFVMIGILYALVSGGIFLVKDQGRSTRTLTSLKWRIGLSVSLFILLFLGFAFGVIQPHSLV